MRTRSATGLLCAWLCACASSVPPSLSPPERVSREKPPVQALPKTAWVPPDADDGVRQAELGALLREHWAQTLSDFPVWATRLGVHRFDDRLADPSHAAVQARQQRTREFLARAERIDARKLDDGERVTHGLFVEQLRSDVATEVCEFHLWSLSPRSNPLTQWNQLHEQHAVKSVRDGQNLIERYRKIPKAIDAEIENLRRGAKQKLYANAHSARLVAEMIENQLARPIDDWPLLEPAKKARPGWVPGERERFAKALHDAVESGIRPALTRYQRLLQTEILPHARGSSEEGIAALSQGKPCYAALIRAHTTLALDPDEVHRTGLDEIERINQEMRELGKKLLKTDDLEKILKTLRSDRKLYFDSEPQIVKAAETALAKAKAAIPRFFGRLPKADCIVRPVPDYEAPYTTIAYYRQPNPDGSKPGEYMINVHQPETRPRFEAEVLAFHESIPGHHLQIAISQELSALPAFRKHDGWTAFVEGWGLYTERLSGEMGLYSADLDRMGMLSFDAWRAARLVVDTGIHHLGWTRARAEKFMLEHTALAPNNIVNEVDRYIVWPGQALAYKIGQLALLRLRKRAEHELGPAFDLRAFHDAVLEQGAVSLPVLEAQIERFIARRRSKRD